MTDTALQWHGQNEEDRYIAACFPDQHTGYFVDVGAFDGLKFSNTLYFENIGWTGLCIEPHGKTYNGLRLRRKNSTCVRAACVGDPHLETVDFHQPTAAALKRRKDISMLSGINPNLEHVEQNYKGVKVAYDGLETVEVPATTLNRLLHEHRGAGQPVDFVSIDTEGSELDVLQGLDLGLWKPKLICVEHAHLNADGLDQYMARMGYVKSVIVGDNTFYVNNYPMAKLLEAVT